MMRLENAKKILQTYHDPKTDTILGDVVTDLNVEIKCIDNLVVNSITNTNPDSVMTFGLML